MEHMVNVRIPAAVWAAVREISVKERRSSTAQLAVMLERAVAEYRPIAGVVERQIEADGAEVAAKTKGKQKEPKPLSAVAQRLIASNAYFEKYGRYPDEDADS